ncbi:MAG: hypothetical protein A3J10_02325 [Candidatus Sungbacteria bacterium RIFCSPLOWO2_02_FULL_54_10]|uniref:Uncharacterized protein n=1 Tax=Candidatus Sungbacteria bacterium RIFCSPHIGHO2_02_FULL_53_17 TaxID=1802275 RepID=A0A1G2KV35_9BACT|nr:MAG: hypothetical protein A2679_01255 [Candidatus Sungbacteria bacterium RIFCSPHIGHO2_01_FULL_54_26]OHA03295.1 MAG: hypothetical protein A3C92_03440 [Candidatus Sungbacteria bacterium RIFCSPHIGHO2_02_FULL_53_17]OHA12343.1 MAG: hypothetical protein A3J10_02325 [Candidatus Sungbacteria bacterium RIFCSPLOWO2_02_FULL_54_10]
MRAAPTATALAVQSRNIFIGIERLIERRIPFILRGMFNHRKKLNAVWVGISVLAVVSMVSYLLLPLV